MQCLIQEQVSTVSKSLEQETINRQAKLHELHSCLNTTRDELQHEWTGRFEQNNEQLGANLAMERERITEVAVNLSTQCDLARAVQKALEDDISLAKDNALSGILELDKKLSTNVESLIRSAQDDFHALLEEASVKHTTTIDELCNRLTFQSTQQANSFNKKLTDALGLVQNSVSSRIAEESRKRTSELEDLRCSTETSLSRELGHLEQEAAIRDTMSCIVSAIQAEHQKRFSDALEAEVAQVNTDVGKHMANLHSTQEEALKEQHEKLTRVEKSLETLKTNQVQETEAINLRISSVASQYEQTTTEMNSSCVQSQLELKEAIVQEAQKSQHQVKIALTHGEVAAVECVVDQLCNAVTNAHTKGELDNLARSIQGKDEKLCALETALLNKTKSTIISQVEKEFQPKIAQTVDSAVVALETKLSETQQNTNAVSESVETIKQELLDLRKDSQKNQDHIQALAATVTKAEQPVSDGKESKEYEAEVEAT